MRRNVVRSILASSLAATVQGADFLTREQKADIFYNNAATFLRLSDEEIARHRGG